MEQVIIGRFCPIIKGQCLETSCAWWIIGTKECHMFGVLQEGSRVNKVY